LPIVAAVDHRHDPSRGENAGGLVVRCALARHSEPEDVHRRAEIADRQARRFPHKRASAVGGDGKPGGNHPRLASGDIANSNYPLRLLHQARRLGILEQGEVRIAARFVGDEIEEVPLRHHRDEIPPRIEMREIGDGQVAAADQPLNVVHLVVRPLEQPVEQAQLREYPQSRGMDGVAAKVAQEVAMLLEHRHRNARPGEEQARDHARRPPADDNEVLLSPDHG
jgi:hypothetical protein